MLCCLKEENTVTQKVLNSIYPLQTKIVMDEETFISYMCFKSFLLLFVLSWYQANRLDIPLIPRHVNPFKITSFTENFTGCLYLWLRNTISLTDLFTKGHMSTGTDYCLTWGLNLVQICHDQESVTFDTIMQQKHEKESSISVPPGVLLTVELHFQNQHTLQVELDPDREVAFKYTHSKHSWFIAVG